jgi:hypothetical protein
MSLFLHQIFYGNNKFDINEESIEAMNRWAVIDTPVVREGPSTSTVDRFFGMEADLRLDLPPDMVEEEYAVETPRPSRSASLKTDSQHIIQHPSVFWCLFVAHYGNSEYIRVGNRGKNRELEEKQKIMETLAKQTKSLKEGSMRLTHDAVQEVLSTLMTSSSNDFLEVVAYAHYYQKNVYVVFDHSYLVFSPSNGEEFPTIVLTKLPAQNHRKDGRYRLDAEPTPETLSAIRDSKIALEHFAKPFRGVSSYKLEELETFARKAGILAETGKKLKKGDLYAMVVEKACVGLCR